MKNKQSGYQSENAILTILEVKKLRQEAKKYVDGGAPFWIKAMCIVQYRNGLTNDLLQSVLNNELTNDEKTDIRLIL